MDAAHKTDAAPQDEWVSQPKAAVELNCSRHKVLSYIAAGRLVSETFAERSLISRESLDRLKAELETEETERRATVG